MIDCFELLIITASIKRTKFKKKNKSLENLSQKTTLLPLTLERLFRGSFWGGGWGGGGGGENYHFALSKTR